MDEATCLKQIILPSHKRPNAYRGGIIQIHVTRACDKACYNCTQGSHLSGPPRFITPDQYEIAVKSLSTYWGVVGMFGGNPAIHPQFPLLCEILSTYIPFPQRGLWCNNPFNHAELMAETFNPSVSNLNCHLDQDAYNAFKLGWPEAYVVGLHADSRHSPPWVAMQDVIEDKEAIYQLISTCDINKNWSAMVGVVDGQVQGWFCEVAGAQAILHQQSTGIPIPIKMYCSRCGGSGTISPAEACIGGDPERNICIYCSGSGDEDVLWWQLGIDSFASQVHKHCFACGIPLRGQGALANSTSSREQVSATHQHLYQLKRKTRELEVVTSVEQLHSQKKEVTQYLGR